MSIENAKVYEGFSSNGHKWGHLFLLLGRYLEVLIYAWLKKSQNNTLEKFSVWNRSTLKAESLVFFLGKTKAEKKLRFQM
jgi:uncharacterized membrane protein